MPRDGQLPSTLVLSTIADTTWRILVPAVLCVGLGMWVDLRLTSKPWLTIAGLVAGLVLGAQLVRMQIKELPR